MLLSRLAETRHALVATRSRNAKRDLIAAVLRDAAADDVEIVVSYLSGSLRQRRTGVGWKSLQSVPSPAAESTLTVGEVDAAFAAIAELAGPGSAAARAAAVQALLSRATADEQDFLRGLVFGDLRQGALEAQVQEGLAVAFGVPVAAVRRAAMLMSSTTAAAATLLAGGLPALEAVGLAGGRRRSADARRQRSRSRRRDRPVGAAGSGGLQAGRDPRPGPPRPEIEVRIFTRSLDDITARLPEVATIVRGPAAADSLVLDGEVLSLRSDGTPEAFQVVASRTMSSVDVAALVRASPLQVFFFDLLHLDGRDLLDTPLRERLEVMGETLPPEISVPRRICATPAEVASTFADAVTRGYEGVVVKNLAAPYAAGRRDSAWVKIKPRHTFDLIVTAVEWGHGRRQGWLSNLHLAARDPASGELIMLGKTFKGLTDELLTWQTAKFLELEVRRTQGTVFVEPSLVVEIACDGLQASTRYPGGVALRFARVLRYRPDKDASEADTIDTVRALSPIID